MIKNFIKDTLKYLPAKIIPVVIGVITIPIITRLFSPTDYGNYALVITTVAFLSALIGWLSIGILRFYPAYERDKKKGEFYSTTIKLLFISIGIILLFFCGFLLLSKSYISKDLYKLMFVGTLVFIFFSFFQVLLTLLRIKRLANWYSGFFIWKSSAALTIGLILILSFKFGIEGLLWGMILSMFAVLPWLWKKAVEKFSLKERISKSLTRQMARYSFPLVLGSLAAYILDLSDRYILNFFRGAQEVGIYSIGYSIPGKSVLIIIALFSLSIEPLSMHIWEKQGEKKTQDFTTKVTRYFLITLLPVTIGLSVLARPIFALLTTEEYYLGYQILPLIAMSIFFLGLSQRFSQGLNFYKKTILDMWAITAAAAVNLGLNFIFVPKYGYLAAAVTTLIGYTLMLLLRIYFSRKFFVWKFPFKSLFRCTLASILMGAGVYSLVNILNFPIILNLFLGILTGVVLYVLLLFLFGEIQSIEKRGIKNFVKQKII